MISPVIDLQVTYLIVDDMHQNIPELTKDQYWDSTDFQLPYTEATIHYQKEAVLGSAADIEFVTPLKHLFIYLFYLFLCVYYYYQCAS